MKKVLISVLSVALVGLVGGCPKDENETKDVGATPVQPEVTEKVEGVDVVGMEVAVTVNGQQIMADEVESLLDREISKRSRGKEVPTEQLLGMQQQMRPMIAEALVDRILLVQAAAQEGIEVTEADLLAASEEQLEAIIKRSGMTREQLDQEIRKKGGPGLDAEMAKMRSDETFGFMVSQELLVKKKFPDAQNISDEEVTQFYESNKARYFTKPEEVRTSHILGMTVDSETRQPKSEAEQEAARQKIEGLLAKAQDPCSDFAALASENSECPSAADGGDLGFFGRQGQMVEEFSAAAFALAVGEVSGVVKSPFGYHIIKVTERRDASTASLEDVSGDIRMQLESAKKGDVMKGYVKELRQAAEIAYGQNYQPTPAAPPMGMPMPMPTATPTQPKAETVGADTVE